MNAVMPIIILFHKKKRSNSKVIVSCFKFRKEIFRLRSKSFLRPDFSVE